MPHLISTNLNISYTGIELSKKLNKYNNTILDGEFIYNSNYNKFIFHTFDILFYKLEWVAFPIFALIPQNNKIFSVTRVPVS